jgi:hypothetical protein
MAILAGTFTVVDILPFKKMSEITEGRWDLWYVALHKFSERPLVGFGFESVSDDLFARLPGVYKIPHKQKFFASGEHGTRASGRSLARSTFLSTLASKSQVFLATQTTLATTSLMCSSRSL